MNLGGREGVGVGLGRVFKGDMGPEGFGTRRVGKGRVYAVGMTASFMQLWSSWGWGLGGRILREFGFEFGVSCLPRCIAWQLSTNLQRLGWAFGMKLSWQLILGPRSLVTVASGLEAYSARGHSSGFNGMR